MTAIVVTDTSTPAELREAIAHLNHRAKREFHVVGSADLPTPWDLRHAAINELLYQLFT